MHREHRTTAFILATAALLAGTPLTRATTYTWTTSTGNWSDPTNRTGGAVPANDPATQVILQGANQSLTSTVDPTRPIWDINSLSFPSSANATLNIANGTVLQFLGTNPSITFNSSNAQINGAVDLVNGLGISSNSTQSLAINASITGHGPVTYTGNGTLRLTGNNTFDGGVAYAINGQSFGPVLSIGSAQALGTGNLTITRTGTIASNLTIDSGLSLSNNIIIQDTNQTPFIGSAEFHSSISNATVTLEHVTTITPAELDFKNSNSPTTTWTIQSLSLGGTLTFAGSDNVTIGAITQTTASSLTVNESIGSTVHITGASGYSGGTTIAIGSLAADTIGALANGTVSLTRSSASLLLNATGAANNSITDTAGTVAYNTNAAAGGHNITIASGGTLTFGNAVTSVGGDKFSISTGSAILGKAPPPSQFSTAASVPAQRPMSRSQTVPSSAAPTALCRPLKILAPTPTWF